MRFPLLTPYSPFAKIQVFLIRFLCIGLYIFKGRQWRRPIPGFTDDSSKYGLRDLLFFSWKYYCRLLLKDDAGDALEKHFAEVSFDIPRPADTSVARAVLHAGGDLMPYSWIRPEFCKHLWDDIGPAFFDADLVVANLETPVCRDQAISLVPEVMLNEMYFNADAEMFGLFNGASPERSFDVLSTANNHSLDMGPAGVLKTLDFLEEKKILACGTARNAEEAASPVYVERKGIRFAFLAWTYSVNKCRLPDDAPWMVNHIELNGPNPDLEPIRLMAEKAKTAGRADIIILCLHYGNAYQPFPGSHIQKTTRRIFESCGIDLVLGSHPHNMQPAEAVDFQCPWTAQAKTGWVIYSLADFVAYDIYTLCHMPIWLQVEFSKYRDASGNTYSRISQVAARPVFLMGHYRSSNDRDLRLFDALRLEELLKAGKKPEWFPGSLLAEFEGLMAYYRRFFNVPAIFDQSRA